MSKTLVIAEAGVNHNGDFVTAKEMIRAAKECGADIVKFQTFNVDKLVSKYAPMAEYQKENTGKSETQKAMLERLQLSQEQFCDLSEYCKEIGIQFLSTPFELDSVDFLTQIQDIWKIPSGEITNYPYLVRIAKTGYPVILSTGMSEMWEIREAVKILKDNGVKDITILHCTTEYPTPLTEVNLNVMNTLAEEFGCKVGYSDHTEGIAVALAAVAMGAEVIEKHFTLDRNMEGPDHKASLEPNELKLMIDGIRKIELAKGNATKMLTESENKNRDVARKSIVASKNIKCGEIFTEDNLTTKRPGNGISPMKWNEIIGKRAKRDFEEDELIEL